MTIRVQDVFNKWQRLPAGQALLLPGGEARRVIIEFNSPAPARIDVYKGEPGAHDAETGEVDLEGVFLGLVHGLQKFDFYAPGLVHVVASSDDDVWFYTADGDHSHFEHEFKPLVKLMQRRVRNREVEAMMFKAQQNAERRFALQDQRLAEQAEFIERLRAANEERPNGDNVGGGGDGTGAASTDPAGATGEAGGTGGAEPPVQSAKPAKGATDGGAT